MRRVPITLALCLGLAATPALAVPFQAVDATTDRIVFLDTGSVSNTGDVAEGDVLFAIRRSTGNLYVLARVTVDCNAGSMGTKWQKFLDENGTVLQTNTEVQPNEVPSAGVGVAIVETICTGVSPNSTTAGVTHDSLQSALTHGRKFLAHHAGN